LRLVDLPETQHVASHPFTSPCSPVGPLRLPPPQRRTEAGSCGKPRAALYIGGGKEWVLSFPLIVLPNAPVFHTYSTYARGLDMLNVAYHYMDLVPKGRDEGDSGQSWVRRRDEYPD